MSNYVDNGVPYGSFTVDLKSGTPTTGAGTAVATYVAENVSLSRPSSKIGRETELGNPNGFVLVEKFITGSATFQQATTTSKMPVIGHWFKHQFDPDSGGVTEYFVISSVGQPFEANSYMKFNVSFDKITTPLT